MRRPGAAAPRSAAPGWYASPGEEGLARFWDGRRWTDARQPLPPPADAVPVLPMDRPITPVLATGYPGVTGPAGAGATTSSPRTAAFPLGTRGGRVLEAADSLAASRVVRTAHRAASVGTGLFFLVFSIIWLVICFALLKPMVWDKASPGAGEATTDGTVMDQHSHIDDDGDRLCSPEAAFAVDGQPYVAGTFGASSDCPSVGSTVTVIYTIADPADSHVAPSKTMQMLILVFPVVGFITLAIGLWVTAQSLGLTRLVGRLRSRRDDDAVGPPPAEPPVIWNP